MKNFKSRLSILALLVSTALPQAALAGHADFVDIDGYVLTWNQKFLTVRTASQIVDLPMSIVSKGYKLTEGAHMAIAVPFGQVRKSTYRIATKTISQRVPARSKR